MPGYKTKRDLWPFIAAVTFSASIGFFLLWMNVNKKDALRIWEQGYRAGYSNVTAIAHEQVENKKRGLPPVANVEQLFLDGMTNNPYAK